MDINQFEAHGALPIELAHRIFETIYAAVSHASEPAPVSHGRANAASREVQQAVADHLANVNWKVLHRRIGAPPIPVTPFAHLTGRALTND